MATLSPRSGSFKAPPTAAEVPLYKPYFLNTYAPGGFTSSGSFVDYPGPQDKAFRKIRADTALLISGHVGAFKATNAGAIVVGLRINSTDSTIGRFFYNEVQAHRDISFNIPIMNGLAPGAYIARLLWATDNSSANCDGNDSIHICIQEGYFG